MGKVISFQAARLQRHIMESMLAQAQLPQTPDPKSPSDWSKHLILGALTRRTPSDDTPTLFGSTPQQKETLTRLIQNLMKTDTQRLPAKNHLSLVRPTPPSWPDLN